MRAVVLVLLVVCLALTLADERAISSEITSKAARDEAANYWTKERMMSAIPKDIVLEGEPTEIDVEVLDAMTEKGPSGGDVGHESILFGESGDGDGDHGGELDAGTHSKRMIGAFAPSYTTYPWMTVGKVFFTMGGVDYVCSGSVLSAYLVATAGHCVYDNGQWARQWTFVPGYNNYIRPYGTFTSYQLWTNTIWTGSRQFCRDYGFAVMNKLNGEPIGNVVGNLGYNYGAEYAQTWRSLGYPAAAPFNGSLNYYSDSGQAGTDVPGGCTPPTSSVLSDATGGASGGPWVIGWGTNNSLNSVNSYKYNDRPNKMFGPYFDGAWYNVMSWANSVIPLS